MLDTVAVLVTEYVAVRVTVALKLALKLIDALTDGVVDEDEPIELEKEGVTL